MDDLSKKKCVACEGNIPSFDTSEIHKYLKMVDGWEVKNNKDRQFDSIKLSKSGINDVNGKNIILIDDITTSGTSINCCAKILEDFGANSVSMLVLGKTVYD